MAQDDRYFARSWALLSRDSGWIKPLLVMSAAIAACIAIICGIEMLALNLGFSMGRDAVVLLVFLALPVSVIPLALVGLGINGYALEWARLVAWGVDAAPKQRGVRIGDCVKSGWRAFVAVLILMIAVSIVESVLLGVFSGGSLAGLMTLVVFVANIFLSVVYMVISLRVTIYQRMGAGFAIGRIVEMIRRDPVGLAKIAGIALLINVIGGIVLAVAAMITILPTFVPLALTAGRSVDSVALVLRMLNSISIWVVLIGFVASLAGIFELLICNTAVALWMRQFNVPQWGASDDPLPDPSALPPRVDVNPANAAGVGVAGPAGAAGYDAAGSAAISPATPDVMRPTENAGQYQESITTPVTPVMPGGVEHMPGGVEHNAPLSVETPAADTSAYNDALSAEEYSANDTNVSTATAEHGYGVAASLEADNEAVYQAVAPQADLNYGDGSHQDAAAVNENANYGYVADQSYATPTYDGFADVAAPAAEQTAWTETLDAPETPETFTAPQVPEPVEAFQAPEAFEAPQSPEIYAAPHAVDTQEPTAFNNSSLASGSAYSEVSDVETSYIYASESGESYPETNYPNSEDTALDSGEPTDDVEHF